MLLKAINYWVLLVSMIICSALILTRLGQIKFLIVKSGSMVPALSVNSAVLVIPEKSFLNFSHEHQLGEIISFRRLGVGQFITHRIVRVAPGPVYFVKGDANSLVDETPVSQKNVFGRVVGEVPFVGIVLKFLTNPIILFVAILLPGSLVVLREIWAIQEELERQFGLTKQTDYLHN